MMGVMEYEPVECHGRQDEGYYGLGLCCILKWLYNI